MQPAKAAHGAFPARRKLAASGSSRAPCAFPNLRCCPRCWLFSCLGFEFPTPFSPKEHQKERCGHFSAAALLHYFSWCASEYSVVGRISCYVSHDSTRTNVCQWLFAEIFSLTAAVSNRIDSIRNLFIIFALDFPALENPILEKNELLYSAILPFVPCLILIFKPIRIILVEIFRVVVFVAQTVRAVVRAAGLVLRWGAWFVLRLMINCSF